MADDSIRIDFEFDSKKAEKNADEFIRQLERDFKKAQKALSDALAGGVTDAKATENVKKLTREVNKAEKELKGFQKTADKTKESSDDAGSSFSRLSVSFSKIAAVAGALGLVAIGRQFAQLAGEAFQATAKLEQTENALNALVARELVQRGDFDNLSDAIDAAAPRAEELLVFVRQLAKASPFGRDQIQQAFQTALAYGFTTDEAQRLVTATVDLAAATGQSAESAGRIALALGQIQAKGKVSAEELNQLREAGFDANGALADLGFTLDDVTKGLVSADAFIESAVVSIERDFGGAAAAATDSLSGLVSTLGDLRSDALVAFFRPVFDILQPQFAEFVQELEDSLPLIEEIGRTSADSFSNLIDLLPEAASVLEGINDGLEGINNAVERNELFEAFAELDIVGAADQFERVSEEVRANTFSVDEFSRKIRELRRDFDGTDSELVELAANLLSVQKGVEQSTLRWQAYGESLQDVADESLVVSETFELSEEQADQAREAFAALEEQSDELSESQQRLAEAASIANDALNEALGAAGGRIDDIVEGRQTAGGGGGSRASRADVERERIENIAEIQREANEETEEARQEAIEETAELQESLEASIAEERENAEEEIADIRKSGLEEIAEAEARLDQERRERLRDFNSERSEAFLDFADEIRAADEAEEERPAVTPEEQAREILGQAAAGGADVGRVSEEAVEAGVLTAEQAADALEETLREQGGQAIADALASGELTGTVAEAVAELNKQIEEGVTDIDLTEFGVTLATAAQIEADIARQRAEERRRIESETERQIAEVRQESFERVTQLQTDAAERAADIQIKAAERVASIQEKTASDIAKANDRAAQAIERAQKGGGRAVENTTEALAKQRAQQLLNLALSEQDLEQKRRLFELSLQELVQVGLLTEAEAARQVQLLELQAAGEALATNQELLNELLVDGETATQNNQQVVELLKTGYFETAQQAQGLASVLRADQIPAFIEAFESGVPLRDILADMGVKLDELPAEVNLTINTNAPEALSELEKFEQKFKELDGQEVNTKVNVEVDERAAAGGGTGSTGAGAQAPGDAFQTGGYTGDGPANEIAGVVHFKEGVIPEPVMRGGIPAIVDFAAANFPIPRTPNAFPAPSQSFGASVAIPPSVTNINNTSVGDTVNNANSTNLTINTGGENRAVRSVVNFQELENIKRIMRR